jgi:glycosyltransferase involved in cell wall biosynthesis
VSARRLLVVTYPYPPMPSVGGNRWLAMAKYLRRAGHEVDVLTTSAFGRLDDDADQRVHRSGDLIAAPWLRTLLRRPPLAPPGTPAVVDKPPQAFITGVLVPDHNVLTWAPYAASAGRRLLRARPFDCVITTSAYESTHLVAFGLGRHRPPWIADFRDGWTFHPWKPEFPTAAQRGLDRWLEARVVRAAQRTVVVERPVGDDLSERLGVRPAYVPNGWDPDLEAEARSAQAPPTDPGRFTLAHTGKLSGGWGRHPGALLDALQRLADEDPGPERPIELVLAGRLDSEEEGLIAPLRSRGLVRHVGLLSRAESMALQRQADALVLITSPDVVWELPGKLFEYLGARRPVVALARDNEAARVVRETGIGWTVAPDDPAAIAALLRELASGRAQPITYEEQRIAPFVYPEPARRMAEEVERAIAGRGPGPRK